MCSVPSSNTAFMYFEQNVPLDQTQFDSMHQGLNSTFKLTSFYILTHRVFELGCYCRQRQDLHSLTKAAKTSFDTKML